MHFNINKSREEKKKRNKILNHKWEDIQFMSKGHIYENKQICNQLFSLWNFFFFFFLHPKNFPLLILIIIVKFIRSKEIFIIVELISKCKE